MTMTEDVPGVELAVRAQPMLPMPAAEAKQVMQAYQETCRAILTPRAPLTVERRRNLSLLVEAWRRA